MSQDLQTLLNLGPKSASMLRAAGIKGRENLEAIGSVEAYVRVKAVHPEASLNLLWALEGALIGEPWQQVAKQRRTSLLLELDDRMRGRP